MNTNPVFLIVDLFCGAGGTTTGFAQAQLDGNSIAHVIACVNHDAKAIESHWLNHPDVEHFEEDITVLYGHVEHGILFKSPEFMRLIRLVNIYQAFYPDAYLILWASLECTNFSKAKGGLPRDADSRTLADHLPSYVVGLDPDYIQIENVVEFMSWGPLDEKGKPISKKNGQDWSRWRKEICKHGYTDDNGWKELNSANFGAYTSRNRLFGCFAKPGLPIVWPEATHQKQKQPKDGVLNLFTNAGQLKPWKPVKEVLDFSDEGQSIFTRSKELSDKTLERIYAGLIKYVAKGDKSFISKYYSGRPSGKVISTDGPAGTIRTADGQALIQTDSFISNYKSGNPTHKNSTVESPIGSLTTVPTQSLVTPVSLLKYNSTDKKGNHTPPSIDGPCPVVTAQHRLGLIQAEFLLKRSVDKDGVVFLQHYYGNGFETSMDEPCPTITTKDRVGIVKPKFFLDKHFGAAQNQSIDQPAGTVMPNDKHRLVEAVPFIMPTNFNNGPKSVEDPAPVITANRKHHYLINPSWGGNPGSVEEPCCVVVARQDKAPLYFVQAVGVSDESVRIAVYETDSDVMIKIKEFMAIYNLIDIKMRMLRVHELLKIQGFPETYQLAGNQADQKKFIGNSVVPHVVKAWAEAMATTLNSKYKKQVA